MDPKTIHVRKLADIYNSYLKNQNQDPRTYRGAASVSPALAEQVHRYSQGSVKELVGIIKLDAKQENNFIVKICKLLVKNTQANQPRWSTELRYLSLVLLRDLMQADIDFGGKSTPKQLREPRALKKPAAV